MEPRYYGPLNACVINKNVNSTDRILSFVVAFESNRIAFRTIKTHQQYLEAFVDLRFDLNLKFNLRTLTSNSPSANHSS